MRRARGTICTLLILFAWQSASAVSESNGLELGPHSVGFRLLEQLDKTRSVTGVKSTYPRPMRTYLWYPSEDVEDAESMKFSRYAALADEDVWPAKVTGLLRGKLKFSRRALARSLETERFDALLARSVVAIENAEASYGPFPLIVMGQGLYYESPVVFAAFAEYLAGRGFVVATCPLVGTDSPFVRIDVQDLETQVRDLEFTISSARQLSFVSQERLGVFGFDMGGMAGLILAMRNPSVDAFASVSSGILHPHPSGIPISHPDYDPLSFRVPWLHSVPVAWMQQASPGESLFDTAIYSERQLLLTESMGHVDYTSYALIEDRREVSGYWQASTPKAAAAHAAVSRYVFEFFNAVLRKNPESVAFLLQSPTEALAGATMTLEHRGAAVPSITYDQFVHSVVTGGANQAINKVRALRETEPNHVLLQEPYLQRLVWSLRNTWGLNEEAMPVLQFWDELHPSSDKPKWHLAESHAENGEYDAAIELYTFLLDRHPDSQVIKARIESLRNR